MSYRDDIAEFIYRHEARFEDGHIAVYHPPKGDGGGDFEVAGITKRHHPFAANTLRAHIEAGNYAEAETMALAFILKFTDTIIHLLGIQRFGPELFLRDCVFNRGETGAVKILQMALGIKPDGRVGPITRREYKAAELFPVELLSKLRAAREQYERSVVGRNEASPFWKGLVNRWNDCHRAALELQRKQNNAIAENAD